MKYCESCGSQLTDNATYCPKCGTRVTNKEEKLSTGEKIGLGIAAFFALTGFFGGLSESLWIAVIVSFLAMAAIVAVYNGSIEKKYAWTTAICAFFAVCLAIGLTRPDEEKSEQTQAQTEQKQEVPVKKQETLDDRVKRALEEDAKEKRTNVDKMMKEAYEYGKSQAMSFTYFQEPNQHFYYFYFTPETDEEIELYKRYKVEYSKGWDEGKRIKRKMDN